MLHPESTTPQPNPFDVKKATVMTDSTDHQNTLVVKGELDAVSKQLVMTAPKLSVEVSKKIGIKNTTLVFKPLLQHVCDSATQIPSTTELKQ